MWSAGIWLGEIGSAHLGFFLRRWSLLIYYVPASAGLPLQPLSLFFFFPLSYPSVRQAANGIETPFWVRFFSAVIIKIVFSYWVLGLKPTKTKKNPQPNLTTSRQTKTHKHPRISRKNKQISIVYNKEIILWPRNWKKGHKDRSSYTHVDISRP